MAFYISLTRNSLTRKKLFLSSVFSYLKSQLNLREDYISLPLLSQWLPEPSVHRRTRVRITLPLRESNRKWPAGFWEGTRATDGARRLGKEKVILNKLYSFVFKICRLCVVRRRRNTLNYHCFITINETHTQTKKNNGSWRFESRLYTSSVLSPDEDS